MGQSAIKNLGNGGEMDGDVTITGDLEVQGGISLSVDEVIQGTSTIDVTNTEALLVRKNDDGGDVFIVDTTNSKVSISTGAKYGTLTVGGSGEVLSLRSSSGASELHLYEGGTTRAVVSSLNGSSGIAFKSGTTEKMRIDASGNVGIGTDSPSRKFTVVNTTTNTATGFFYTNAVHTGVDTHSVVSIRSDNASSNGDVLHVQGDGTGNLLTLSKDGSDKLTVTHEGNTTFAGNVGIGVTSLQANSTLEVNGRARFASGSAGLPALTCFSDLDTGIHFPGSNVLKLATAGTDRLTIDASGNATFGGAIKQFRDDSSTVGTNDVVIENDGSGDASLKFSLTGATDWFAYVDNSDSDKFKIRRSTTDHFTIDESGNATFTGDIVNSSTSKVIKSFRRLWMDGNNDFGINNASGDSVVLITGGATPATSTSAFAGNATFGGNINMTADKFLNVGGAVSKNNNIGSTAGGITIQDANVATLSLWDTTNAGYHSHFYQVEGNSGIRSSGSLTISTNAGTTALTIDSSQNATFAGDITVPANKKITIGGQIGIGALNVKMADGSNQKRTINIVNADDQGWAFGTVTESNRVNFVLSKEYGDNSWSDALKVYNADGKFEFLGGGGATFAGNIELDHSNLIRFTGDTTTPTIGGDGSHLQFSAYSGIDHSVAVDSATFLFTSNQAGTTTTIYGGGGILTTGSITSDALLSNTSSTYDIGSSSNLWRDAYLKNGGRVYFGDTGTYVYGSSSLDVLTFAVGANERFKLDVNSRISLSNNDSGTSNTVFGKLAGDDLASGGNYNSLFGENAGHAVTTGDNNTAIGYNSLDAGTDAHDNTAIGFASLGSAVSVGYAVAIGNESMNNGNVTSDADGAVGIGYKALYALTSGASNTAIGYQSAQTLTTGASNVSIGYQAMGNANLGSDKNVMIGKSAFFNGEVDEAVFIGFNAGGDGTTTTGANGTVGIGKSVLNALTSGAGNTAVGYQSLKTENDGSRNTAIGYKALTTLNTSAGNGETTAIGFEAGMDVSTGIANTFVGSRAGNQGTNDITTGSNNTMIGKEARGSASGASNQTVIGASAIGVADNSVSLGNASVTNLYIAKGNDTAQTITFQDSSNTGGDIQYDHSDDQMKFGVANAVRARLFADSLRPGANDTQDLGTASSGWRTLYVTDGINFPDDASANPSSDANTLDNYEEGTWSPTFHEGSNTLTFPSGTAVYTKVGNMVHLSYGLLDQTTSGTVSGTGQFQIRGLPFAPKAGIVHVGSVVEYSAVTFAGAGTVYVVASGTGSNTILNLYQRNDAQTLQNANITGVGANSYFSFQISYPV